MIKNKKILLILLTLVLMQLVYSGFWTEVSFDPDVDPDCNALFHVMCAEKDYSGDLYNHLQRNISYRNYSGLEKTGQFCAIYDNGDDTCDFELFDGASPPNPEDRIYDLDSLKNSGLLCEEKKESVPYNSIWGFYDENCDGDEIFEMNEFGRLNTTRYIENNLTFDVSDRDSNIDYFDIIVDGVGGIIEGVVTNTLGEFVEGANITLFFDNPKGTFIPYRSYITSSDGYYTTKNYVDIETYYRNTTTDLIPRTDYVIIIKHEEYLDSITQVPLAVTSDFNSTGDGTPIVIHNVTLNPVNLCESDCTLTGSNLCMKDCNGINGCLFQDVGGENLGNYLDGMPSGITVQQEINGEVYKIETCEGEALTTERLDVSSTKGPDCPADQEVWKTTQLVRMDGQVVKMVVTLCQ